MNVRAPYPAEALHVCDWCFGPLEVVLRLRAGRGHHTRERIAAGPRSIWRYADLLPVSDAAPVDLGAGFTPLVRADRLAAELGLGELWIKNDTVNPTGSFKDRVVSVALTKARELGFKIAACASTGNLANSVAAHAARAGMESVVLHPARPGDGQSDRMTSVYGGTVIAVDGSYDDVNRLCAELAGEHPTWAFVNVNVRTYYAEGSKTLAFEVAEQLGWQAPDHVVVPDGVGQSADQGGQGLRRVVKIGLLDEQPRCASPGPRRPVARRWPPPSRTGRTPSDRSSRTPSPSPWPSAIRPTAGTPSTTVRESGGACASVTDDEIVEGIRLLARTEGIFAETAGGVTIATLAKLAASGGHPPGRTGRRLGDRARPEDGGGPGRCGRSDRYHRSYARGLPRRSDDVERSVRGGTDERQCPNSDAAAHARPVVPAR